MIWNSSPCQDISLAGKQAGAVEGSGTRSSLIYEVIRIANEIQPKYMIWENVKNLTSKKHKPILDDYINRLSEIGYNSYYQVLNAKDYGIPQSRERVFVVSIRKDIDDNDFRFPQTQELKLKFIDMLDNKVDEKYYLNEEKINNVRNWKAFEKPLEKMEKIAKSNICSTITTRSGAYAAGMILTKDDIGIRRTTPKELWRLMGFDDEDFDRASKVNSDAKLCKQAGNSVVVNVIEAIFSELLKEYQ